MDTDERVTVGMWADPHPQTLFTLSSTKEPYGLLLSHPDTILT